MRDKEKDLKAGIFTYITKILFTKDGLFKRLKKRERTINKPLKMEDEGREWWNQFYRL